MSAKNNTIYGEFQSTLNITTATVVKASPGAAISFTVIVAGSGNGSINDVATNAPEASNQIATIPQELENFTLNWPCNNGILVVPGTGQTVAIQWQ